MTSTQSALVPAVEKALADAGDGVAVLFEAVKALKPEGETKVSEALSVDIEIVFRLQLGKFMRSANSTGSIERLLLLAMGYALTEAQAASTATPPLPAPTTGKLPFLLFEDLMEGSVLEVPVSEGSDAAFSARRAWSLIESSRASLIDVPALFTKGKIVLLRMCNGLVRRLSKTHDTEWCGRVLMFLTAAYPLSERSAVNVKGESNTLNVTSFEQEEQADLDYGEEGAETKTTSDKEEGGEDATPAASSGDAPASGATNVTVDYALYKSLWGLQKWMLAPNLALSSPQEWEGLLANSETLVGAFEFYGFTEHELEQGRKELELKREKGDSEAMNAVAAGGAGAADDGMDVVPGGGGTEGQGGEGGEGADTFFGCKYLTTARLLRLQLVDPQLRLHIITQLWVLFSHLRSLSEAGIASVKKDDDTDPRQPSAVAASLDALESRLDALLARTPPNGPAYQALLKHVLGREVAWKSWKDKKKCEAYEKYPVPIVPVPLPAGSGAKGNKRKREAASEGPEVIVGTKVNKQLDLDNETIGGKLKAPTLLEHMDQYLEADDPENGIEDSYHPKHEKAYCWRASRLVMANKSEWLADMSTGSLEKVSAKLKDEVDASSK